MHNHHAKRIASRGVVRYDARGRCLLISKPWGILRLHADPVDASALDLRRSPDLEWTHTDHVRIDLRKRLRLVSDLLVGSKWKWSERGFAPTTPRHPIDPAVAECAVAWRSWLHAVGRDACQAIAPHLDCLGPMTLDLLAWHDSLAMVTNRVIHEAAQLEADSPQRAADLSAILQVLLWKEQAEPDMHVRLRSLEQLQRLVGNVQSHLEHEGVAEALRYRFPEPPLPGEPGYVEPILNAKDLCWESIVMQNCAISYAREISEAQGQVYFYRGYPKWGLRRCTIGIEARESVAGRRWQVFEVRTRYKQLPTGTAKDALSYFFEDQEATICGGNKEVCSASTDLAVWSRNWNDRQVL
jgi:hypothetical protein